MNNPKSVMFFQRSRAEKGAVYVLALLMMLIFFTLASGLMVLVKNESKMNENHLKAIKAFYFAESGLNRAIAELISGVNEDGYGMIGSIGPSDLDGDLTVDHSVVYIPETATTNTGTLIATGTMGLAERTIVAKITRSPWRGALQSNGVIDTTVGVAGALSGDVVGGLNVNLGTLNTNGYKVIANDAGLIIPLPNLTLTGYKGIAGTVLPDCTSFLGSPPGDIYFIEGNCTINLAVFDLSGALIVNGALTITGASALTITGAVNGGNVIPPIIANGDININTVQNAVINGLIFSGGNVNLSSVLFSFNINKGAIVAVNGITMNGVSNLTIGFDENLKPPYFAPNNVALRMLRWKGHR